MEARGVARVSRVEFSTSLWVLRCFSITLVPPVVAYRRVRYRQRHSGLLVFWLKCWIWGAGSGIRFHTQVVWFVLKVKYSTEHEKIRVESSTEEERDENGGGSIVDD